MSLSATYSDLAPARRERTETRTILLIIWAAAVVSSFVTGRGFGPDLSTDDAMRLVEVRDLLAGQGWFDLTQYRLNPPDGVVMHWSRVIDLPLALLTRAGMIFMPAALAEQTAAVIWPVGLLLVLLAGIAQLARTLADDAAARLALFFTALTAALLQHFRPGAIDHHNAQLVLLVWSLALVMRERARDGALAGLFCAISVAIGAEMFAAIATIAGMVALRFIVRGETARPATAGFAFAFAAAAFALFVATVPPTYYLAQACDALSIVQLTGALMGGLGLAALARVRALDTVARRLAAAAALAATVGATMALAFPACLGDPFAYLDARMTELWLAHVTESRNVLSMLRDLPQEVGAYYGLPAAALVLGLLAARRVPAVERWPWAMGLALLAVMFALALWQVRATAAANAIAVALLPASLVRCWPASQAGGLFLGIGRTALIVAALLSPLTLIAIGSAGARVFDAATHASRPTVIQNGAGTCGHIDHYAPLARLPRGRVLGFIDAGPFLLAATPHGVLAAPYHRNSKGNGAMFDVFLAPASEAASRLKALGVDYLAFCPGAAERFTYSQAASQGLAAALGRGEIPDGLERIPLEGTDLVIYRPRL